MESRWGNANSPPDPVTEYWWIIERQTFFYWYLHPGCVFPNNSKAALIQFMCLSNFHGHNCCCLTQQQQRRRRQRLKRDRARNRQLITTVVLTSAPAFCWSVCPSVCLCLLVSPYEANRTKASCRLNEYWWSINIGPCRHNSQAVWEKKRKIYFYPFSNKQACLRLCKTAIFGERKEEGREKHLTQKRKTHDWVEKKEEEEVQRVSNPNGTTKPASMMIVEKPDLFMFASFLVGAISRNKGNK